MTDSKQSFFVDEPVVPPPGFIAFLVWQFPFDLTNRLSGVAIGKDGIYIAGDRHVWFIEGDGCTKYGSLDLGQTISSLCIDRTMETVYASTFADVFSIAPNNNYTRRVNRAALNEDGQLADLKISPKDSLFVSSNSRKDGGIFTIGRVGTPHAIIRGPDLAMKGLWIDADLSVLCLETSKNSIVKRSLEGRELSRIRVDSDIFESSREFDGRFAVGDGGSLYLAAGRAGTVFRLNKELLQPYVTGLRNPTGIAFDIKTGLLILESGRARLLSIQRKRSKKKSRRPSST